MSQKPFSSRLLRHLKNYGILWFFFLFFAILASGYALGYRIAPGLAIVRSGVLSVSNVPDGAAVYVNSTLRGLAKKGAFTSRIIPGSHNVIVDVDGMNTWEELVMVRPDETTTVAPLLVPKNPSGELLINDELVAARKIAFATVPPTAWKPLAMGCTNVYLSQNRIMAVASTSAACTTPAPYLCEEGTCSPTVIYDGAEPVRSVIPYPNRTDTIIASAGSMVYVIELDPRQPRFFVPLVRGFAPTLATLPNGEVIALDDGAIFRINIEK